MSSRSASEGHAAEGMATEGRAAAVTASEGAASERTASDVAGSDGAARRPRLLFVHAHPDDETLTTGVTMAAYASRGCDVHLLTCTLGEEGEVIPQELVHLDAHHQDTLGPWRREELRAAMSVLGVAHSVLGEDPQHGVASRYRDSGMAGTPSAQRPEAFVRADLGEAAALVADHIGALSPDVVVTYDEHGGYGHPDHIQTHRVTMAALSDLAAKAAKAAEANSAAVPVAFCIVTPQSWASQDRAWLADNVDHGKPPGTSCVVLQQDAPYPPSVVGDERVSHYMEEPALVGTQSRALAQHATQVVVSGGYYVLSNRIAARLSGREGFARFDPVAGRLVSGLPGAPRHRGLLTDAALTDAALTDAALTDAALTDAALTDASLTNDSSTDDVLTPDSLPDPQGT